MKIAYVGHKQLSRSGGVEVVVSRLAHEMTKRGHEVTVYNRKESQETNEKRNYPFRVITVPTINKKGLAAVTSSFFATIKILLSDADIAHYHAEGPCMWLWIIKILSRKKVIVTIHGLDWKRSKWNKLASSAIMLGEKIAAKYADEIIVLNYDTKKYFKEKYSRETHFISNGVDIPVARKAEAIKQKYNLQKNSYILYLGRIVPEKGVHYLIEAYKGLKTDAKLVIAGGPSDTDEYYRKIKQSCDDMNNIIFTGFVEGKELEELYSNALIYCLPSDIEGMPLSLIEAMSYGNCCITSDIPECKEITKDNGIFFKRKSPKDLQKKLQYLLNSPSKIKELKAKSVPYVKAKCNWDTIIKETEEIYLQ